MKKFLLSLSVFALVLTANPYIPTTVLTAKAVKKCCMMCSAGKACGNACIARNKVCHKATGCACNR